MHKLRWQPPPQDPCSVIWLTMIRLCMYDHVKSNTTFISGYGRGVQGILSKGAGVQRSLCTAATVPMDTEGTYLDKTYAIEVVQRELRNANLNQSHDLMLSGCRVTLTVF